MRIGYNQEQLPVCVQHLQETHTTGRTVSAHGSIGMEASGQRQTFMFHKICKTIKCDYILFLNSKPQKGSIHNCEQ